MQEEELKLCREVLTFHRLREQKPKIWNDVVKKTCRILPKLETYKIYDDTFHDAGKKEKPDRAFIFAMDRLRKQAYKNLSKADRTTKGEK